ncbi:MAG: DUF6088 family protein [Clostridiales bacterium]|nr:DUF6088 family protein [Clostridiales bacterium]
MEESIYQGIKNTIAKSEEGTIFLTKDFADIASAATVRKCLERQTDAGEIRRILNGVYDKPRYSEMLKKYLPADPDAVASAIARNYRWNIALSGDVALNRLGLSTQVPTVWSYISDGPYREFKWDNITLSFKHRTNREISNMSDVTVLVIEALKTLGKERITGDVIERLRKTLSDSDKKLLLSEAASASGWVYETVRKVCAI